MSVVVVVVNNLRVIEHIIEFDLTRQINAFLHVKITLNITILFSYSVGLLHIFILCHTERRLRLSGTKSHDPICKWISD